MLIVLGWIVLAIAAGAVASAKGRSGIGWFLLSLLITPVLTLLMLAALPNQHYVDASGVRRRVMTQHEYDRSLAGPQEIAIPRKLELGLFYALLAVLVIGVIATFVTTSMQAPQPARTATEMQQPAPWQRQ
jgi:uncharacterized membrane protein